MPKFKVVFQAPELVIEASSKERALEIYDDQLSGWYLEEGNVVVAEIGDHLDPVDLAE